MSDVLRVVIPLVGDPYGCRTSGHGVTPSCTVMLVSCDDQASSGTTTRQVAASYKADTRHYHDRDILYHSGDDTDGFTLRLSVSGALLF